MLCVRWPSVQPLRRSFGLPINGRVWVFSYAIWRRTRARRLYRINNLLLIVGGRFAVLIEVMHDIDHRRAQGGCHNLIPPCIQVDLVKLREAG